MFGAEHLQLCWFVTTVCPQKNKSNYVSAQSHKTTTKGSEFLAHQLKKQL